MILHNNLFLEPFTDTRLTWLNLVMMVLFKARDIFIVPQKMVKSDRKYSFPFVVLNPWHTLYFVFVNLFFCFVLFKKQLTICQLIAVTISPGWQLQWAELKVKVSCRPGISDSSGLTTESPRAAPERRVKLFKFSWTIQGSVSPGSVVLGPELRTHDLVLAATLLANERLLDEIRHFMRVEGDQVSISSTFYVQLLRS